MADIKCKNYNGCKAGLRPYPCSISFLPCEFYKQEIEEPDNKWIAEATKMFHEYNYLSNKKTGKKVSKRRSY